MTHFENVVKMCSVAEVTFKNLLHPEWSRCGSPSNFKNISSISIPKQTFCFYLIIYCFE